MKQNLQTTLLALAVSLILSSLVVNADTPKTMTSEIKYHHGQYPEPYHRFLPDPAPEELYYRTRMRADANIDDTPEKESIVIISVDAKHRTAATSGNWLQAYLLITDNNAPVPNKKTLFKLFDLGTHDLEDTAKPIDLQSPPFIFKEPIDASFRLVDVTGDGTLDVWVECEYGVALISFQNGAFEEVFSNYTVTKEKLAEMPEVEYHYYKEDFTPQNRMYHRFLATTPPPAKLSRRRGSYHTRMTATANIDDTPEKETIVLMVMDDTEEYLRWSQAFLLIAENEADVLKKKDLFKLFDSGTYDLDVPGKTIEVQSAPFVFQETAGNHPWTFGWVFFKLVDLTGDGILDVWIEHASGVAVISFQNGEFKEICSGYSSTRREDPIEYIDIDNDGIYEIKIPDRISFGGPGSLSPEWISFYEWDGNTYVLNNRRFYADNDKFLTRLLAIYKESLRYESEVHSFYIGLVYYYRGNASMARQHLQWVVKNVKKQDYIQAAESILKKLPPD